MWHTCHFSSWEAETGLPQVGGQSVLDNEILLGKEKKKKQAHKDIHQNIGKNRFIRSDRTACFLLQIIAQFLSQITRDL